MTELRPSRRIVFQGLSALGVAAVLAGCGGEQRDQPRASSSDTDSTDPAPSDAPGSRKPEEKADHLAPDALATTDEIPVGGGIILTDARIVITQPKPWTFRGFSAVCTHQGQTVGRVSDNTITCLAHGSQYDAATGDVTMGPATDGLDPVRLRVRGDAILRA
jgi:Rieske Fe-S protein